MELLFAIRKLTNSPFLSSFPFLLKLFCNSIAFSNFSFVFELFELLSVCGGTSEEEESLIWLKNGIKCKPTPPSTCASFVFQMLVKRGKVRRRLTVVRVKEGL